MRGSRVGREARRRPELDLIVGPLEAATMDVGETGSSSDASTAEVVELTDPAEPPAWREDG
jgi:hypothetical protein